MTVQPEKCLRKNGTGVQFPWITTIIGGIGNIPGAMFGGSFLGIWKIPAGLKDTISFLILIIFLLLRPGGIFNIGIKKNGV